jgi:arylsulfatase A-like enzyme
MTPQSYGCRRLCAVALVGGLAACTARGPMPRPSNVLIVTLDTTRADRLPAYGDQSASMPALDRLAREGVVFDNATTVAPLTLTAHTSLFTGLYPTRHGVRDNADAPLDRALPTLAEVLKGHGFRTAAFVGSSVLAAGRGLSRGFDVYGDVDAGGARTPGRLRRPGNEVVDAALAWLNAGDDSPFLLWVHLYDAHAPYRPPEPYRSRYAADPYEAAIAFADSQVARIVDALDARHQLDRTAIVVAADHGESLGQHGEDEHGIFLYDSVMHVPLLVRMPGIAPRRISSVTSLVDVMPTILDALGITPVSADGISLLPAIRGSTPPPDRSLYTESLYPQRFGWSPLRALRDGRFKLIDAPRPELYDLEADPFEQQNIYADRTVLATAMTARLAAFTEAPRQAHGDAERVPPDLRGRLAALGYVGGAPRVDRPGARDPKDVIAEYNQIRRRPLSSWLEPVGPVRPER